MSFVLVTDADPHLAELYRVWLGRDGHDVRVWDGESVPDPGVSTVVVEASQPGAAELVRSVRSRFGAVRVVATGIYPHPRRTPPLGADTYLLKPFPLSTLTAAVTGSSPAAAAS